MEQWKKFELECNDYLNEKYGDYFNHMGFSDSTVSDIKYKNNDNTFYIEAKMPSAQSGQFVVIPDYEKKEFIFSPKNRTKEDENTKIIIEYMNENFDIYSNPGTSGKSIEIDQDIFSNWIVNYYKQKGVKFFITKGDDFIIFPIEKYSNYFHISATYRIKKSGSNNVPKNRQKEVIEKLNTMNIEYEIIDDFKIHSTQNLDKVKFTSGDSEYMFRKFEENIYRIRKLSNTRNPNVIFSIELIKNQDENDLGTFLKSI